MSSLPASASRAATPASNAFRPPAPTAGPTDYGAQIRALSPPQRVAAARQAEILSVIGQGLAGYPYAQRRSILDHLAPPLAARGVPPETLRAFDPTDDNLAAALAEVAGIRRRLAGPDGPTASGERTPE